jgi:hypothetical protein
MNNNAKFLASIDAATKGEILASIAKHYGISAAEAYTEVADDSAEHLLDYMVEPQQLRCIGPDATPRHALTHNQTERRHAQRTSPRSSSGTRLRH